jgi:hypothetical protein
VSPAGRTEPATGADYFNRGHPLHGLKARFAMRARARMYRRVLAFARAGPETRIVDVGVTPDLGITYGNFFERWYPHPERVTVCSTEDCSALEGQFPGLRFRLIRGDRLPFEDGEFDLALSFAVLEHVGSTAQQRRFLGELARVAPAFVAYTPYRYFPVEMHTLLPLLHWLPVRWHRRLLKRLGLDFWAEEANLNLLARREARALLPPSGSGAARLLWTAGWPSNIELTWRAGSGTPAA